MAELTDKINFDEVEYLYKSPDTMVDYSDVVSFTLIKSSVEIFQYYGITSFSAEDIKRFFEKLSFVRKKNGKVFVPSVKKINGVLECFLGDGVGSNILTLENDTYKIVTWAGSGCCFEIDAYRNRKSLSVVEK